MHWRLRDPGLSAGRALAGRYRQEHRRYHTLEHLADALGAVGQLQDAAQRAAGARPVDRGAVLLAACYHDAVYDISAADNEERSARLAERQLAHLGACEQRARRVGELVRATAEHDSAGDVEAAWLCDADLLVLASDPARYRDYARRVRAEYGRFSDEQWRSGRAGALRGLLARPRLFARAGDEAERAARKNLTGELRSLT